MSVQVFTAGELRPAGRAWDSSEKYVDMRASMRVVEALPAGGLFRLLDRAAWLFEMRYTTPEAWSEFVDKPTCGGIRADDRLLETALSLPDGCIVLTEKNRAFVFERLS